MVAAMLLAALSCTGDDTGPVEPTDAGPDADATALDAAPEPVFPEAVENDYFEMRDCRHSHEHELRYIRVFASPTAQLSYAALSPDVPYPVGATLVKLEYDDAMCSALLGYTAMQKLPIGQMPAGGDWLWQRLDTERNVLESGAPLRCTNCHTYHCAPPYGYDLSCAEEL
jgi:hypothetical protein